MVERETLAVRFCDVDILVLFVRAGDPLATLSGTAFRPVLCFWVGRLCLPFGCVADAETGTVMIREAAMNRPSADHFIF